VNADARRAAERIVGRPFARVDAMPTRAIPISRVFAVTMGDGQRFAVKCGLQRRGVDPAADPIATEWAALVLLANAGRRVPAPVGYDRDARVFVTKWVDGPTVDDACQGDVRLATADVSACLRELREIHRQCEASQSELAPHVPPQDDARIEAEFAASFERAREAYYACLDGASALRAATVARCDGWWQALWAILVPGASFLGSADVNARNIILSPQGPCFLDFSSLGWDWPERRAACYMTSLGRYHTPGRVACALSREAVEASGHGADTTRRVEGHAYILACLALASMMERPTEDGMLQWTNPDDPRSASARELLALGAVADVLPTSSLRREAAAALGPVET